MLIQTPSFLDRMPQLSARLDCSEGIPPDETAYDLEEL
jgi:hypothetical protein